MAWFYHHFFTGFGFHCHKTPHDGFGELWVYKVELWGICFFEKMVTVNQWNWRLVVCWGWTSTTNGESKTPNDIVSVDRRSRRPTGPELRVDPHGISWFISQPSKNLQTFIDKPSKHPGPGDSLSKFHSLNKTKTQPTNTQSRSPGRAPRRQVGSPGAGSLQSTAWEPQNRPAVGGSFRATAAMKTPRARHPSFFCFSQKKKNVNFKKVATRPTKRNMQNAKEQLRISSYIQKNSKKTI